MAATPGQPARSVGQRLFDEPYAFEFAQAVRLLELLRPGSVPLGTGLDPRAEALTLAGALAPVFAPSALGALRLAQPRALAVEGRHLGLRGEGTRRGAPQCAKGARREHRRERSG